MCRITRSPFGPYFSSIDSCLLGAPSSCFFAPIPDVAFALEHLGQAALHLRKRHLDTGALNPHGIADAGEHIGDGVGHHVRCCPWSVVSCPLSSCQSDSVATNNGPRTTDSSLPTRVAHAGNQTLVGQFAEANAADAKLRYTARGRPHSWQRFSRRELNFGVRFALAIFDLLATEFDSLLTVR